MNALGESISFGRFMSESLSWEKWSTFSHNRYVEEAERYAQPGSVAQKKAFFEAHYKRVAAQKAAALLEQTNAANNTTELESETVLDDNSTSDSQTMPLNSHEAVVEQAAEPEVKTKHTRTEFLLNDDDEQNPNIKSVEPESAIVGGAYMVGEQEAVVELTAEPEVKTVHDRTEFLLKDGDEQNPNIKSVEPESVVLGGAYMVREQEAVSTETSAKKVSTADDVENQEMTSGSELSGTAQMEKPLLKSSSDVREVSSVKSKKKSAFSSLKSSIYRKTFEVPFSPAKPSTSHVKKESNATPITKKPTVDLTEKKKSTPKSLRTYINSTPAKEPDKLFATATRKTQNSETTATSYKASQDCATPLRTPNLAPSARMSKHAPATRLSENTRTITPINGSKTAGPKWHLLSAVCPKSLTACCNKIQSPTLSTPIILRTEERAARRKQKLEEKFNSNEVQKVQLQTKSKEKAELELRKLRQSFCFKARPLPDFYKERKTSKNQTKQSSVTQPQSPKLGRKPSSSTIQGTNTLPSSISLHKSSNISKHVSNRNGQNTTSFFTSVPEIINHENTSPNIQY